jgi:hypothetical protein
MTVKERLHELIEGLDEEEAKILLALVSRDAEPNPRLTPQQAREIQRRLDNDPAEVISNEEVFARLDVASEAPGAEKQPHFRALTEGEIQGIRSAMSDDDDAGMSTEQLGIAVDSQQR